MKRATMMFRSAAMFLRSAVGTISWLESIELPQTSTITELLEAMGGSFSQPAILVNLGHDIRTYCKPTSKQQQVGWVLDCFSPTQLIAGILHVDDALVASGVLCYKCLVKGMKRLWPSDVGTSLEEHGSTITEVRLHTCKHRSMYYRTVV